MVRAIMALLATSPYLIPATPARADPVAPGRGVKLTDEELARITGKFILPNGVELALTVTSDTVVNGQLLLRTVLTVDQASTVQVLGRQQGAAAITYTGTTVSAAAGGGVTVTLDRNSGLQTVTPTVSVASGPAVSIGAATQSAESLGLSQLPLTPGGPAIATADGVVSLQAVPNGTRVTFAGDQLAIVNLVGQSVATAVLNSADNRTLDTVTNIMIDARNIAPYQAGMAQMRVDNLAVEATRGMIR